MADPLDIFANALFDTRRTGLSSQISGDPALNAFANTLVDNNLYKLAASPLLSAKFDTTTWKPATTLGVTAGQAFLGAMLQGLGQNWEAEQLNKASAILPQMMENPASVAMPEGISSAAFEKMRLAATREKAVQDMKESAAERLFGIKLSQEEQLARATAKATQQGQMDAFSENPDSPLSPLKKADADKLAKIAAEEDAARKEIFERVPTAAQIANVSALIPSLDKLAKDDTKSSDVPFVYQFVKAQDGGVVKEGEAARVQGASPMLQRYAAELDGALNGKSTLTPKLKKQMVEEMKGVARAQLDVLPDQMEPIFAIRESRGAARERMMPFNMDSLNKMFAPEVASAAPAEIPPGMKLQRNRVTGETRLVPK